MRLIDEEYFFSLSLLHILGPIQELTRTWLCSFWLTSLIVSYPTLWFSFDYLLLQNNILNHTHPLEPSLTHSHFSFQHAPRNIYPREVSQLLSSATRSSLITILLQQPVFCLPVPTQGNDEFSPFFKPLMDPNCSNYLLTHFPLKGVLWRLDSKVLVLVDEHHLNLAIAKSLLTPFAADKMGPLTRSSPNHPQLHLLVQPGLLWLLSFFVSQSSYFRYQPF